MSPSYPIDLKNNIRNEVETGRSDTTSIKLVERNGVDS